MKQPKPSKLSKALAAAVTPPPEGFDISFDHQPGVMMSFPKAVDRLGFTPEEAFQIAHQLTEHAREALTSEHRIITLN